MATNLDLRVYGWFSLPAGVSGILEEGVEGYGQASISLQLLAKHLPQQIRLLQLSATSRALEAPKRVGKHKQQDAGTGGDESKITGRINDANWIKPLQEPVRYM